MHSKSIPTGIISIVAIFFTWFFIDSSAAGIVTIIAATLILSLEISADAAKHLHPEIIASLQSDDQTILIENIGTGSAEKIKVRIIPDGTSYDAGDLLPDTSHQYMLPECMREGKAAVSWEKKDGTRTEKIFRLSGYADESDPLRPVFPLFGWKEK